jgi:hypothetical protein
MMMNQVKAPAFILGWQQSRWSIHWPLTLSFAKIWRIVSKSPLFYDTLTICHRPDSHNEGSLRILITKDHSGYTQYIKGLISFDILELFTVVHTVKIVSTIVISGKIHDVSLFCVSTRERVWLFPAGNNRQVSWLPAELYNIIVWCFRSFKV